MTPPQQHPVRSYCKHPDAETQRSCSGLCRGPGPSDDCEYFQHEQPSAPASQQRIERAIKELEYVVRADVNEDTECHILKAIALLRGERHE